MEVKYSHNRRHPVRRLPERSEVRRLATLLAVPAAVITLLAGCSSSASNSGTATPPSSQSASASAASGTPISVGAIGVFSGPVAQSSLDAKSIIQAWAASVNAAGGIDGHPIQLYVEDTTGSASVGLTAMKTLVEQDHVVAIVGNADNNPTWASYADGKGIPVVGGGELAINYMTDPNWYTIGGNLISVFEGIAELAQNAGPRTAMFYCSEAPGCAAAAQLLATLSKPRDVTVSVAQGLSASTSDFTAQCEALKSASVSSWDLSVASALMPRFVTQCKTLGFAAPLIEPGTTAGSQLTSQTGFNGVRWVDAWAGFFEDSTPATKEFHDALAKYAPQVGSSSLPLNSVGMGAWISGKLFEAAIKASGASPSTTITSALVKKGLYALKDDTLGGLTVPLTYTEGQPTLFNCYFQYTMTDNKFTTTDAAPTCADHATNKLIGSIVATFKS
jgi:branched-chain amino acid transport system substrate-binding protein